MMSARDRWFLLRGDIERKYRETVVAVGADRDHQANIDGEASAYASILDLLDVTIREEGWK